jgi:integrase
LYLFASFDNFVNIKNCQNYQLLILLNWHDSARATARILYAACTALTSHATTTEETSISQSASLPMADVCSFREVEMALVLIKRNGSPHWYLRGSVRGIHVYESTKTDNDEAAETIRILRERELLDESIFGKKINVTFENAAESYLESGGSTRFLSNLTEVFGSKLLRKIKQHDLDAAARTLYPDAAPETLNRQCYTPFTAVWNHAVGNEWADFRKWKRPRKPKGTVVKRVQKRSGDRPVEYELAVTFVSNMSPAPAMVMTALFYSGMRPIELFTLEASDVDIERRCIALNHTNGRAPRGAHARTARAAVRFANQKERQLSAVVPKLSRATIQAFRGLWRPIKWIDARSSRAPGKGRKPHPRH